MDAENTFRENDYKTHVKYQCNFPMMKRREGTKGLTEYKEQRSCMLANIEGIFEKDHGKLYIIAAFLVYS